MQIKQLKVKIAINMDISMGGGIIESFYFGSIEEDWGSWIIVSGMPCSQRWVLQQGPLSKTRSYSPACPRIGGAW